MNANVYKNIKEVDKNLWDSIVKPDHIICTHAYLQAIEESNINDCEYRYIIIFKDNKLIAHTCIYSMSFDLDIFNIGVSKKIIGYIRKIFYSEFLKMRIIECGTPTALGNTITFANNVHNEKIMELIVDKMKEYAKEKKINILVLRDFYEEEILFFDILKKRGFKRVKNLPDTMITNKWNTFQEYLVDMRKNYRHKIKLRMKRLENNSIKVEVIESFKDIACELKDLWMQVYNRATEYQREILTLEYFKNMDIYLKEKSKVILFKKNGKIIGFAILILDDYTSRPYYLGMDYAYNKENYLFFNILYQIVKNGIEEKKRMIEMGITTYNVKKDMGVEILPLFIYIKHLSPIFNIILTNLFSFFSTPPKIIQKHVFNRRYFERIYTSFKLKLLYKGKVKEATVINISEEGININSNILLKTNSYIYLKYCFPDSFNFFIVKGRVQWSKRVMNNFNIGVKFINLDQEQKDKLQNIIPIFSKDKNYHGKD